MTVAPEPAPSDRDADATDAPTVADVVVALPTPAPGAAVGPAPRLARSRLRLADGHQVGVAVAGRGVPLVVVHGFAAEGILYAQTLARLVGMGFKVVAIDSPGHGATDPLGPLERFPAYVGLLERTLDELGLRRYVLAGHSMGGRLVTELAARRPAPTVGLVLVNAIVGGGWDRTAQLLRYAPPGYALLGAMLAADAALSLPVVTDPRQATKLARLIVPVGANHVRRPWRLVGPFQAIARARPSVTALDLVREAGTVTVVVHGDRDGAVPWRWGRDAARRLGADLVVVHGAGHSWLLRDPETFPAIMAELVSGRLGHAIEKACGDLGVAFGGDPALVDAAFCEPGARIVALTPEGGGGRRHGGAPRYRWTSHPAASAP